MSVSRSPAHFPLIVVFVIAFIGSTNLSSLAQEENIPEKRPFHHQGQLTNVQAPFLEVRVGDKTWVYKVEAEVDQIKYIAQAETSWLRPGMYVRYDGADEKGRTVEPIKELFVFSPRPEFPVYRDVTAWVRAATSFPGYLPRGGPSKCGGLRADLGTRCPLHRGQRVSHYRHLSRVRRQGDWG